MVHKIVSVLGTRPQIIKASVVSYAIKKYAQDIKEVVLHTGQHYDDNMSAIFFNELEMFKPDYSLNIGSATHGRQTGEMLIAVEQVLQDVKPDLVLVYGDTNSTLAGALAAAKLNIPIAHVEAGLRSFNKKMPEEVNRVLTDHMSSILFAPTKNAMDILSKEGIDESAIHLVGDVMYDVALFYAKTAQHKSTILSQLNLLNVNYFLATIHRSENTDCLCRLKNIFDFLCSMVNKYRFPLIIPLHPRTKFMLIECNLLQAFKKTLTFIEPVGYLDMIMLEKNAACIFTDSGGVQKEAFFYKKPCITLRNETEWVELGLYGWNKVVSPENNIEQMSQVACQFLNEFQPTNCSPYGCGDSANLVAKILLNSLISASKL